MREREKEMRRPREGEKERGRRREGERSGEKDKGEKTKEGHTSFWDGFKPPCDKTI